MRVGVLALQGGFAPHLAALRDIGIDPIEVRRARDLDGCDGIVLPGGESPTQLRLIDRDPDLFRELNDRVETDAPLLATCAGLILAAREVRDPAQRSFGWLDVAVRRNAWGRQIHSAEATADDGQTELVLIRAPRIEDVGPLASVELTLNGEPVLVRQGRRYGATFHPELGRDRRIHERVFVSTPSDLPAFSPSCSSGDRGARSEERESAQPRPLSYSSSAQGERAQSSSSSSSSSSPSPLSGSMAEALSISSSQNSRH